MRVSGIRCIITSLFLLVVCSGCLPQFRKTTVHPGEDLTAGTGLPRRVLDKRITYLTSVLDDQGLSVEDRELALSLLSAYEALRDAPRDYEERDMIKLLFTHLSELDERYFTEKMIYGGACSDTLTPFFTKRDEIVEHYLSGDYQAVINECIEFREEFGSDSLTPDVGLLFAISLGRKGMLGEALNIGETIAREMDGKPDLIHLRANAVRWHLALGHKESGLETYEKLVDNVLEREAILKSTENRIVRSEGGDEGAESLLSETLDLLESGGRETDGTEQLLREVDALVESHEFEKAKILLIRYRIGLDEGPGMEIIDQALKSVELAEQRHKDEVSFQRKHQEETLKKAEELIEEEEYEAAIAKIQELEARKDLSPETQEMKDLATEKLINRERNKAAKLFLEAKKTQDPEKRAELLLSSYSILKALRNRYPSSPMSERLDDHMAKVRDELNKLGRDPG